MGYAGFNIGEDTVRKGVFETIPMHGLITTTGGSKTQFYKRNQDFDDIDYLRVCTVTDDDGGADPILYVDIGGANKITSTYANGYHYETIDCTSITGVNAVEIYADIANADSYIEFTMWVVCS